MSFDDVTEMQPFSMSKIQKNKFLVERFKELIQFHSLNCEQYRQILSALDVNLNNINSLEDVPFFPARLFKQLELRSVPLGEVIKTMTSSGTSGQRTSRIFLDRKTAAQQTRILSKVVGDFIGKKRLPLVILDTSAVVKDRALFSARGAGILGFSMFGSKKIFALDENMFLDESSLVRFLSENHGQKIMLFGFTYMVWLHFIQVLEKSNFRPDLSKGILIHGGGFKKLADQAISKSEFKYRLNNVCGISHENIHDYYGMVEQTGSIYMECEQGHLHASIFSDVIIRRANDFSVADFGEKGIVQVLSILPQSYPGHSLLTEDEGICIGEDDCPCGRLGKYFQIEGRLQSSEIRGCSDTYANSL